MWLDYILVGLFSISFIVSISSDLRTKEVGRIAIDTLSEAGLSLLKWRAYANYKRELVQIRKFTGYLTIVSFLLFFSVRLFADFSWFTPLPLTFLFIWISLKDGLDFKKTFLKDLRLLSAFIATPWVYLLMNRYFDLPPRLFEDFSKFISMFGVWELSPLESALILSLILGIACLLIAAVHFLTISFAPALVLFILVRSGLGKLDHSIRWT
jgi:hypothetical protein